MGLRISELNDFNAGCSEEIAKLIVETKETFIKRVTAKIRALEESHGFSSNEMREKLKSGEIRETLDICDWLLFLRHRDRLMGSKLP